MKWVLAMAGATGEALPSGPEVNYGPTLRLLLLGALELTLGVGALPKSFKRPTQVVVRLGEAGLDLHSALQS